MYLVRTQANHATYTIILATDPREDGWKGEVVEGVELDKDEKVTSLWGMAQVRPSGPVIGQDPNNTRRFKMFADPDDLRSAGFLVLSTQGWYVDRWKNWPFHHLAMS